MTFPTFIVIPPDMGSNIREGSTVPGAPASDVQHWVATIFQEKTGRQIYPKQAIAADYGTAAIDGSDNYETSPAYVRAAIAAALATLSDIHATSISYNTTSRIVTLTQTDNSQLQFTLPLAATNIAGLLKIVTASQALTNANDDQNAATPALVAALIANAIAAIPPAFDTKVANFTYNTTSRVLSIIDNAGVTFNVTIPAASGSMYGLVKLAVAASYPANINDDLLAATPAFVKAAIAAAIAGLPGDKYLQGLQSYDPVNNIMTLLMNDGSTVAVDMTQLLADAIASIPQATQAVFGKVQLATAAGGQMPTNDLRATTPAYVAAAIAAAAPTTVDLYSSFGGTYIGKMIV